MGWLTKIFPALAPYVLAVKLALIIGAAAACFLAGCYVTRDHYAAVIAGMNAEWAKDNEAAAQAQVEYAAAQAQLKHDAEVQHAKEQLVINDYRSQLADGMLIHIPTSNCAAAKGGSPGADPDGGAGALQQRVDAAFAQFLSGAEGLISRCDQLNIDAREMNSALDNQEGGK